MTKGLFLARNSESILQRLKKRNEDNGDFKTGIKSLLINSLLTEKGKLVKLLDSVGRKPNILYLTRA